MNNRNISFLIHDISNKGGTERITVSLANYLAGKGYNISIISLMLGEKNSFFPINDKIEIYSIFNKKRNNITLRFFNIVYILWRIIKRSNTNILINVDVIQALFSLPCKLFIPNLRIISWEHFNYKTNLGLRRRDYARYLSKQYADAIVTLTEQDKLFYLHSGKIKARTVAIPNFTKDIPPTQSPLTNKLIIAVGRFHPQKGFDILIDVWEEIKHNPISDGWILQIIGDGSDKEKIKEKVELLNLSSSIQIIDATKEIEKYYLSASMYVMTSRFEGLPMVLIEAKSYGLPIISFDCITGPREIIENGEDGFLIDQGNIQEMSEKVCYLMDNTLLRKQMGKTSKENVNKFLIDNIYTKWNSLFQSLN